MAFVHATLMPTNQQKYICELHFYKDCSSPGTKKLNANTYSTLHLPAGKIAINHIKH